MSKGVDEKSIEDLLSLGVADVIVREDLKKKLLSGKVLRIKLGIDPTGFDLHLGHMVVVHKLREFQLMGHQVVLLFGNFTGQIGDPSGKDKTRPMRTQEELEENAKDYLKQISKLLDLSTIEVRWNADWLAKLCFGDVVRLASNFTVAQMLERDMFKERMAKAQAISLHEFFYPLMQGYDSVPIKADVELGGTDQTFNVLAARPIQKNYGMEPQNILTVPLLIGTDGSMKMGKSTGNYIAVDDKPEDMFGKIMSIPDTLILHYFELAGRANKDELDNVSSRLEAGENPRDLKMELGQKIVSIYHGAEAALRASDHFIQIFQKKGLPDEIEESEVSQISWKLIDLVFELEMASSKSDARRLIEGGGLQFDGERIDDLEAQVELEEGRKYLVQAGKRRFKYVSFKS